MLLCSYLLYASIAFAHLNHDLRGHGMAYGRIEIGWKKIIIGQPYIIGCL